MRLAFVTTRYGAESLSGAEHACRLLAEHVCVRHDVDVLTTCARDARTWTNEYGEGSDRVRGVVVRRFAVEQPYNRIAHEQLGQRVLDAEHTRQDEIEWLRSRGPACPGLLDHLRRQHRSYDALVFFGLLDLTTLDGLSVAPDRSILIPYLQLHPALRFGIWPELLAPIRALGCLSTTEQRIARAYLGTPPEIEEVVGIGVEAPPAQGYPRHQQDPADDQAPDDDIAIAVEREDGTQDSIVGRGVPFRRRHRLYGRFALYGGRIESHNGCQEMLEYFDAYAAIDSDTSLVLMGARLITVPEAPYLRFPGVLPDRDRMAAYESADVTLSPSDDLLAQTVLESLSVGTPVLASARNDAAVEHCRLANAGLFYANREEFVEGLRLLTTDDRLRTQMGENGRQYVRQYYRWDAVISRFERLVSRVKSR